MNSENQTHFKVAIAILSGLPEAAEVNDYVHEAVPFVEEWNFGKLDSTSFRLT